MSREKVNDKADFTQGSILGKLIPFMIPILGALVLQAAYGAVDLLVVGRFGTTSGLSAVSTGSQVLNLVTFVITQFAMGITVLIARYIGREEDTVNWCTDWRFCSCICGNVSSAVCYNDRVFASYCCIDAGTRGSSKSDICLCKDMRKRYFLYCCL